MKMSSGANAGVSCLEFRIWDIVICLSLPSRDLIGTNDHPFLTYGRDNKENSRLSGLGQGFGIWCLEFFFDPQKANICINIAVPGLLLLSGLRCFAGLFVFQSNLQHIQHLINTMEPNVLLDLLGETFDVLSI